jgi:hypothetical protein
MVQQNGKREAQNLLDIAKSTYDSIPLEERPVLTEKSEPVTADDIYLSQENGDLTSFWANHVPQTRGGNENSFTSVVVSNMSSSMDRSGESRKDANDDLDDTCRSEESRRDDNEEVNDSETISLLDKSSHLSSHSNDSLPESTKDEPSTESSTQHERVTETTHPNEDSNDESETMEFINDTK